jgi:hypothetical protein
MQVSATYERFFGSLPAEWLPGLPDGTCLPPVCVTWIAYFTSQ